MTFAEAKEKLKEMAGGKYHSLRFGIIEFPDGRTRTVITAYIEDIGHTSELPTYDMAINTIQTMIQQHDNPQQIEEMCPQ